MVGPLSGQHEGSPAYWSAGSDGNSYYYIHAEDGFLSQYKWITNAAGTPCACATLHGAAQLCACYGLQRVCYLGHLVCRCAPLQE